MIAARDAAIVDHASVEHFVLGVSAHVHPTGSVPMAAMMIANPSTEASDGMHSMHAQDAHDVPATIAFPFGFPSAGVYRIFVQFSRNERIETASFVARVE